MPLYHSPQPPLTYESTWNASTNTPTLSDATGVTNQFYIVDVAGSQNLGSGSISFAVGDWVVYEGNIWQKIGSSASVSPADPTTLVGLSAINGSAPTFLRSDSAPALNQAIAPTWTGLHTFNNDVTLGNNRKITFSNTKNYEVLSTNLVGDDRLIFRATSAIEARFWFDSFANDTGITIAEGGTERLYFGTELGGNAVLDTMTYPFKLKTHSATNFANIDTSLLTADRIFQFPDAAGTLALTSGFASGTYAPTVTPGSNAASATANGTFIYSRVGSSVQVSGELAVTASAAGPTLVDFSLPVAPPDFANTHQLSGSGAATTGGETTPLYARANTGTKNGTINWIAPNTSAHTVHFIAMYTTT